MAEKEPEARMSSSSKFLPKCMTPSSKDSSSTYSVSSSSRSSLDEECETDRHHWGKKTEYILAAIGYCVGLGNIWRFPYVCMRNGGGAFLIPFFLSLFVCALPMYFLESAMGQFNGRSALHVWSICPLFKGLGLSMNAITFICSWYYSIILAWSLIYFGHSFSANLPWTLCGQSWNTPNCYEGIDPSVNGTKTPSATFDLSNATTGTTMPVLQLLNQTEIAQNLTSLTNASTTLKMSSAEEFWLHNVLERSSGLDDLGGLPWHICLALIAANLIVLVGVIKGIRSTGKVVYVTATLPYLLISIMLILGITLPGSGDGILFYIKPDFGKLMDTQTWVDAFLQVFYSLGPGWGGLITMGSYNKFKNNCMKDSILLTIACEGTSVFGGFAIFAILGHMAHSTGIPIADFARSGAGLAFVVYPTAISYLPLPQLWGILFFLMLFVLGLDSQFTNLETLLTSASDTWVRLFNTWRKTLTTIAVAFFTLAGMVFATRGGIYIFTLVDWYVAAFSLLSQSVVECIIVAWIYGADRFSNDIKLMLGRKPYFIFVLSWKYIAPAILTLMFGVTLATYKPPVYGTYKFSSTAEVCGWLIAVAPFSLIVIFAFVELFRQKGSLIMRIKNACKPGPEWGPADPLVKEKYFPEAYQYNFDLESQQALNEKPADTIV